MRASPGILPSPDRVTPAWPSWVISWRRIDTRSRTLRPGADDACEWPRPLDRPGEDPISVTPRALHHGDGGKREPAWSPTARSEPPLPRHPDRRRTAFGFVVLVLAAAAVLSLRVGTVPFVPGFPRPVSGGEQDARLSRPFLGWLFRPFPGALLPSGAALLSELRNL